MKYGYEIINGKTVINEYQSTIINKAMVDYINGVSLKKKAEELTEMGIEYAPGKSNWNKNRIQRMITDKSYLGTEIYPQIFDKVLFDKVINVMSSRNTQKNSNREEVFSSSIVPVCCGECGCETIRRYESKTKVPKVYHTCINPECNKRYTINDMDLRLMVREKLTLSVERTILPSNETLLEIRRLNNEIDRELQAISVDEITLKNKIFQCAALQYSQYTKEKESIDYSQLDLCSPFFNREVKRRVKSVYLENNQSIWLLMTDGQIIGKDDSNNGYSKCC